MPDTIIDDNAKHLLSKQTLLNHTCYINQAKIELEKLECEHNLICRYHERLWFQRTMHQTKEELLYRHRRLASLIEGIEYDINESKRAIYLHNLAVEELANSMTPYNRIDLRTTQLVSQQLF